jgi:hypothetical protein
VKREIHGGSERKYTSEREREKEQNLLEGSKLGPLDFLINRDNQLICNTNDKSDKCTGNFFIFTYTA